jgi:hypothetical protein
VVVRVLPEGGPYRLVEQREADVGEVEQFLTCSSG